MSGTRGYEALVTRRRRLPQAGKNLAPPLVGGAKAKAGGS
jgi:hypothetical protein